MWNYNFHSLFTFCVCPNVKMCDLDKKKQKKNYAYSIYRIIPREFRKNTTSKYLNNRES